MNAADEIEQIYHDYSQDVYRYLLSMCHDPHLAEDLTQDTFLQVIRGIFSFRRQSSLKTWMFTIARHEYLRWLRKNHGTAALDETLPLSVPDDFTDRLIQKDQVKKLLAYLRNQGEPHRSLLSLRLIGEFSFSEIAAILGKTETWARVTFMRDKRKLMEHLKEELE